MGEEHQPRPSIGRIVRYHHPRADMPAIITAVHSEACVNLHVFIDGEASEIRTSVEIGNVTGGWSWPPR
jgi:hypothetical protein